MPTPDPGKLFPLPKRDNAPRICVTLQIPGDQESISNFVGAVMRLALWNNYRRDDNKRAKNIAQVWKGIVRDIEFYDCNDAPNGGGGCEDGCDDMCCLRVFEGKLQSMQCGVWTTIDGGDLTAIAGLGVQQPAPGGDIEAGDCQQWDVTLYGSNTYILPVAVQAGWEITISAAVGGWSDGDVVGPFGAAWSCPSGQVYALGTCGADNGPDGADPLPSVNHMRLVANVGGDFYDAYNRTITVPGGVTDSPVTFQANDAAIANNLGSITFHVQVCNKEALQSWSDTFNSNNASVQTDFDTVAGRTYRITCVGSVCHNPSSPGDVHDAIYTSSDGYATYAVTLFGAGPLFYGLILDSQNIPVLPFNAGHSYSFVTTGTGAPFVFKSVVNAPYSSCGGDFTVTVQELAE